MTTDDARGTAKPPTAQIVVEILEQLDRRTDREHGLTAAQIAAELGINEKTVRGHLRTLAAIQPFGRTVGHLDRAALAHAESADPRPGWYIAPVFDTAQMRLLADGAMISHSDGEYTRDLIDKVRSFAGRGGALPATVLPATPKHYNREFLNNIELLDDAIAHERAIGFHYCTYDVDGRLVPRRNADGTVRDYHADPYHLLYKNNMYYLVCHLHRFETLSYLHVERLRDLTVDTGDHSVTRTLASFAKAPGEPFDIVRHMNERPYPVSGPAVPIRMRLTGTLEPLYDWFDDAEVTCTGTDAASGRRVYEVRVTANEKATLWWALQYADSRAVEILGPDTLREALRDVGRYLTEVYAKTRTDTQGQTADLSS